MIIILPLFIVICLIVVMVKTKNHDKNGSNNTNIKKIKFVETMSDKSEFLTQDNKNSEQYIGTQKKFIDNLSEEAKEKMLRGDFKMTNNITKKVIKYQNGEKISEEETSSNNVINKKAIRQCPNCGANIDLNLDRCIFCKTKIN